MQLFIFVCVISIRILIADVASEDRHCKNRPNERWVECESTCESTCDWERSIVELEANKINKELPCIHDCEKRCTCDYGSVRTNNVTLFGASFIPPCITLCECFRGYQPRGWRAVEYLRNLECDFPFVPTFI